jgi:hypothetical protein
MAGIRKCIPDLDLSWTCCAAIIPFSSCTLYLSPPEAEDVEEEVEFFISEGTYFGAVSAAKDTEGSR